MWQKPRQLTIPITIFILLRHARPRMPSTLATHATDHAQHTSPSPTQSASCAPRLAPPPATGLLATAVWFPLLAPCAPVMNQQPAPCRDPLDRLPNRQSHTCHPLKPELPREPPIATATSSSQADHGRAMHGSAMSPPWPFPTPPLTSTRCSEPDDVLLCQLVVSECHSPLTFSLFLSLTSL